MALTVSLWRDLRDLIFPPACACCGRSLGDDPHFCDGCAAGLEKLENYNPCTACALPIGPGGACPRCGGQGVFGFERIVALAPHREPLRKAIHQMKYHHRWSMAEILGRRMLGLERVRSALVGVDRLVPVPLHWRRNWARGYNQAEGLANYLSRQTGVAVARVAVRRRNTLSQTNVATPAERADNVRGAFELLDGAAIAGRRIALIDDVITTGSTLRALRQTLAGANPAEVRVIVIAVADPRRRDFQVAPLPG